MGMEASSFALTSLRYGAQVSGAWGRGVANQREGVGEVTFTECSLCTVTSTGLIRLHVLEEKLSHNKYLLNSSVHKVKWLWANSLDHSWPQPEALDPSLSIRASPAGATEVLTNGPNAGPLLGDTLPAEFYLQVNRFSLLPTEQPRERVIGCNQDPDVQKKLYDCLEEHLSESISPSAGLSLSQLLDEVQEDQEHRGALVHLAESCLMLAGPYTAPPLTRWTSSHHTTTGEAMYTVPSSWLHISENDQRVLSSLGPGQRTQDPELPPPDPALEDLSLTLISPSSPTSSGTPALPGHMSSEESGASISLLPALSLAASDPVQKGSSRPVPAICSAPGPLPPSSIHPSRGARSPLLSCAPSLSPLGHVPSPRQAIVTRSQKPNLEFKELGLPPKNRQHSPRTKTTTGALESSPVRDPPKKHRDGSAFQYEYEPPCTSLCAQVQAVRLPPQLVAWALHLLMEPQLESELTQV
uniref:ACD shelterin complex subunit and telomerase recruitment factor n=1 Tax=Panthera leo TaxID=9689 RepID=A0A8C8XXL6_PANLE